MTKKQKELKTKLFCDIKKFIAEEHNLNELKDKANSLCLYYFPSADIFLLNTVIDLSFIMQNMYFCEMDLDELITKHKLPL